MTTLLREAFYFSRTHLKPLLLIALLYSVPSTLMELNATGESPTLNSQEQIVLSGLLVCLGIIQFAAAMLYIHGRVQGTPIRVGKAIRLAMKQLLPLLLLNLLIGAAVFGGLVLLILPGLFMAYKLLFAEFLLLFHQRNPIDALKESYRTTQGMAGQILPPMGMWIALVILLSMIRMSLFEGGGSPDLLALLVQEGLSMLLSVFGWALMYRLYQCFIADQLTPVKAVVERDEPPAEE